MWVLLPSVEFAGIARLPVLQLEFLARLGLDLVAVTSLVRLVYHRYYRRTDLFMTFFSFNLIIFLIAFLLNRSEMSLGAAFGLFAVFSMLRYRTEGISARDMTYLFLAIALGLITAIGAADWSMLLFAAALPPLAALLLESGWLTQHERSQKVHYENAGLVEAGVRPMLIAELKRRTGLEVLRVDVDEIDYLRDAAWLTVYYRDR